MPSFTHKNDSTIFITEVTSVEFQTGKSHASCTTKDVWGQGLSICDSPLFRVIGLL